MQPVTFPKEDDRQKPWRHDERLFIEAGGFSTRNPVGRKPPWQVMKRQIK